MSWTLIESQTLSGTAASVTLGSGGTLPQTYKTLVVKLTLRTDSGGNVEGGFTLNNGSYQTCRYLYGTGAGAGSAVGTYANGLMVVPGANTANTFGNCEIRIPNYSSTTAYKVASADSVEENNGSTAFQEMAAILQEATAAVTYITIRPNAAVNFVSGCTFTLYGLK